MTVHQKTDGIVDALTEQQALAECLRTLWTRLQQQPKADPVVMMETALAAVALTRTWLEPDTVQAALEAVSPEQLTWWEHELVEDEAFVARLRQAVQVELDLTGVEQAVS